MIYGLFRADARLYRNAVLRTGARLRISEAWHGDRPGRSQRIAYRGGSRNRKFRL